ncbi:MAG: pyruvate, phosphate dikinase, partial [Candidatus Eremiobacteraeota bacterium]|nr:pyruvate, phosphate dikinase [Candidatus Eremiobacteraeota bacterium]
MAVSEPATKFVYFFDEGDASMRELLGGKGAGLAEMTRAGLPVPDGFTISTKACLEFFAQGGRYPDGLQTQINSAMERLEKQTGKVFGDAQNPLLVSVRSGARASMPGMMDTILNLGLNDQTVQALVKMTGNERFAWDAYRRFVMMFSNVVLDVEKHVFEEKITHAKERLRIRDDTQIDAQTWKTLVAEFKKVVKEMSGREFPQDVREQLDLAVRAVFESWNSKRAIEYRRYHKIPDDWGTAVNVVAMVFGNLGDDSGTGVAFTRDPNTGDAKLFGEYLRNAQGEDVVAGIRTPERIADLERSQPNVYAQFEEIARKLERHYRDMQ